MEPNLGGAGLRRTSAPRMIRRPPSGGSRSSNPAVDVHPIPGLEHLPYAEVWFHAVDDDAWRAASDAARAIGKTGLEVWTTTRTPEVAPWLEGKGYDEVRRYVISELDVAAAPDLGAAAVRDRHVRRPARPRGRAARARAASRTPTSRAAPRAGSTRPGSSGACARIAPTRTSSRSRTGACSATATSAARGETWSNGFMAVARAARGRGVAGAIKRAQIALGEGAGDRRRCAPRTRCGSTSMLDLNRRLGYVPLYEEIVLRGPAHGEDLRGEALDRASAAARSRASALPRAPAAASRGRA